MNDNNQQTNMTEIWLGLLQASGYRITGPRRAIVEIMATTNRALGPIDVFDLGRKEYPGLGLVTVYRTLEKLEELRLVQRVHQPVACNRYLRANTGHEHILLCSTCGKAVYFSGDDLNELIQTIAVRSGFEIKEHWLQFYGLCSGCQEKQGEDK